MKNVTMRAVCVLLASVALAGCYAQLDDSNVSFTRNDLCPAPSCPASGLPLNLANLVPPFTIDLGDSGVLTSSQSKQGPLTFNGSLALNRAVLAMQNSPGADFNGVTHLELRAVLNNDPACTVASDCKIIASYDAVPGSLPGQTLVLEGSGINLLDIADGSHQLTLALRASGTAPTANFHVSLELDMSMMARASFP